MQISGKYRIIIMGTAVRLSRLVDGDASPFKPKEMKLCLPIPPLSEGDVKRIIELYLGISSKDLQVPKLAPSVVYGRWAGRAGILIECLIVPFLNSLATEKKLNTKKDYCEHFRRFEKKAWDSDKVPQLLIKSLNKPLVLKQVVKFGNSNIHAMTLKDALSLLYYAQVFRGANSPGLDNLLPRLVEHGLFYVTRIEQGGTLVGQLVEEAGLRALDKLFIGQPAKRDRLYFNLLNRHNILQDGFVFEKFCAYILCRYHGKRLKDCPFFKEFLTHKKNKDYGDWIFYNKYYEKEFSTDDGLIEKVMYCQNKRYVSGALSSKFGEFDLVGNITDPRNIDLPLNEQRHMVMIFEFKLLSGGNDYKYSYKGVTATCDVTVDEIKGNDTVKENKKFARARLERADYISVLITGSKRGTKKDGTAKAYGDKTQLFTHVYFDDVVDDLIAAGEWPSKPMNKMNTKGDGKADEKGDEKDVQEDVQMNVQAKGKQNSKNENKKRVHRTFKDDPINPNGNKALRMQGKGKHTSSLQQQPR